MNFYKYIISAFLLAMLCHNLHAAYAVSEEWSTYVGGQGGNDNVKAAVIGADDTLYFGGAVFGGITNTNDVNATTPPFSGGGKDGCVGAVNFDGTLQWYVMLISEDGDEGEDDEVQDIALHGQSVYAAACMQRPETNDDGTDAYLFSLTNTSGSVNWSRAIAEAHTTNAFNAITVDTNGNIYAVGYTSISQIEPTPNVPGYQISSNGTTFGRSLQGGLDAFVVKFSPAGTRLWVHYFGGANDDSALACAIGTNGFLYVGGETCSTDWVSYANNLVPSRSNKAGFVVKMNTAGEHIWSTYLGGSKADSVTALAVESETGRLFVAGTTFSGNYMSQHNPLNVHGGGSNKSDGFVTSITDNGDNFTVNWSKFYGSTLNEKITSIQQLHKSEMIVGGTTPSGTWLPAAEHGHSGGDDGFVVVLQADTGTNLWSTYIGGNAQESLNTIAARNGIFYAGGMTRSEGWVTNGFHTAWDKFAWGSDSADEFGFLCKYQSDGYVPDLPLVTSQPQPVTVEEQRSADFFIASVGTQPIFYQWRINGVPVAAATNQTFTITAVQLAQDGDLIACALSNIAGTTISDNARLTVTPIPNGWITVAISPTDAVDAGAAWSIDSGATWYADGAIANAITGKHSIVYKDNLFGWKPSTNAPASTVVVNNQTNTLSALYTEVFYSNYREISGTNVTVFVDPPEDASHFLVTESLPVGLIPYDYAPFLWDTAKHQLKHITLDTTPTQLSYSVMGADGVYQLSGNVNFGDGSEATVGDNQIVIGSPPPVVPDPDIIGFAPDNAISGNFLLTFISILGQNYLIETNRTPAAPGWAPQTQMSGEPEQTTTSLPAPHPALFYRVRTPAP